MTDHSDVTSYNESWNARMEAQKIVDDQNRNNRTALVAVIVFIIVLALGIAGFYAYKTFGDSSTHTSSDDVVPHGKRVFTLDSPENVDDWGGISFGKGLKAGTRNEGVPTVTVYYDHLCTHCNHLENEIGDDLFRLADEGKITLVLRPLAFMHEVSYLGAQADLYVASVAPESFSKFHKGYIEKFNNPIMSKERDTAPTLEEINALAQESGMTAEQIEGLDKVLTEGTYADFLDESLAQFQEDKLSTGTPTVMLDDKKVDDWSQLPARLDK